MPINNHRSGSRGPCRETILLAHGNRAQPAVPTGPATEDVYRPAVKHYCSGSIDHLPPCYCGCGVEWRGSHILRAPWIRDD